MKQSARYIGYSPAHCEAWYECPVCKKRFGDWTVLCQKENENGTNKYCPDCKTELDGIFERGRK